MPTGPNGECAVLEGPNNTPGKQHLGNASALLAPYVRDSELPLADFIRYPSPYPQVPQSEVYRLVKQKLIEVRINVPSLLLGEVALHGEASAEQSRNVFVLAREIAQDLRNFGSQFVELHYIAGDKKKHEKDLKIEHELDLVELEKGRGEFSYLSFIFRVPEKNLQMAAPRMANRMEAMLQFCVVCGLERAIEGLVDRPAKEAGPLYFKATTIPLPDISSLTEALDSALPEVVKPSSLSLGGSIGRDRPLLDVRNNIVRMRIPCLMEGADCWGFYLNEGDFARRYGIEAHYVEFPSRNSRVSALVDVLAEKMSAGGSTRGEKTTRREPGYWMIEAPLDPQNPRSQLKALVQYVSTFRGLLREGTPFWMTGTEEK